MTSAVGSHHEAVGWRGQSETEAWLGCCRGNNTLVLGRTQRQDTTVSPPLPEIIGHSLPKCPISKLTCPLKWFPSFLLMKKVIIKVIQVSLESLGRI